MTSDAHNACGPASCHAFADEGREPAVPGVTSHGAGTVVGRGEIEVVPRPVPHQKFTDEGSIAITTVVVASVHSVDNWSRRRSDQIFSSTAPVYDVGHIRPWL